MSDQPLTQRRCQPCEGGVSPLTADQANEYLQELPEWELSSDSKVISRHYLTANFMAAIEFMNKIAAVAELEDHHPDLHLEGYRRLKIDLSTHAIGGLSVNDFIVAAKINQLYVDLKD